MQHKSLGIKRIQDEFLEETKLIEGDEQGEVKFVTLLRGKKIIRKLSFKISQNDVV